MPWVRFLADHDHKPTRQVTIAYRAGQVRLVTTACAKRAIALGRAVQHSRKAEVSDGQRQ
ncbi:MAG: hypothetical protein ACO1OK_00340 [Devosia sp.]